VGANQLAHDNSVTDRGIEGLVASSLAVEYVLANDFPIREFEGLIADDLISVDEAVEDETVITLAFDSNQASEPHN